MNKHTHHDSGDSQYEQGAMGSYVIGFILSLVFTFIPYVLVIRHSVSGTALLVAILGFAMVQMIIQMTFFLHLGRGPRTRWNLYFFVATFGIVLVVVGGSVMIIHNLHYNMQPSDQVAKLVNDEGIPQVSGFVTGACQGQHPNHQVIIKNGLVSPQHTTASKCDTLSFIDDDPGTREITFGPPPQKIAYAGESDLTLTKRQNVTITLSQSGSYIFYDYLHVATKGDFTVSP